MTLIDRMQELLEAERAGVKCLTAMSDATESGTKKDLLIRFRIDEGTFCAGLYRLLQMRGAVPSGKTGTFADKVLALPDEGARIGLLIKGQAWVVRRIDEFPADEANADEKAFFAGMRAVHVANIEECRELLQAT